MQSPAASGPVVAPPGFRGPDSPWTPPSPDRTPPPAVTAPPAAPPLATAPVPDSPSSPSRGPGARIGSLLGLSRPAGDRTPTDTSSADGPTDRPGATSPAPPRKPPIKVDAKLIEDAAGAILGVAVLLGVWAVRARSKQRRTLRRPDEEDQADATEALGRILHRRANLAQWAPDLIDTCIIIGAAGSYAGRGPLTTPLAPVVPVEPVAMEVDA